MQMIYTLFIVVNLAYLQGEYANAAGSLRQDGLAGLQSLGFQPVKAVPCGEGGARQGAALLEVEGGGHVNETVFLKGAVLAEGTVVHAP